MDPNDRFRSCVHCYPGEGSGGMSDILLVEGDVHEAEIALESLKVYGLANRTYVAGDGQEALDFLLSQWAFAKRGNRQPSLILLDLTVPILSGLEVLRIVKGDPRSHKIPVVVLTEKTSDLDIHTAMKLGADAFTQKPLTSQRFLAVARQFGIALPRERHTLPAGDRLAE